MNVTSLPIIICSTLLLCACDPKADTTLQDNIDANRRTAIFDTNNGRLPFPNNLLFAGSTDATLNIPVDNPGDYANPKVALNELDGFSTTAPITAPFSTSIDPGTVNQDTVRMFQVSLNLDAAAPVIVAVNSEMTMGTDFVAGVSGVDDTLLTLTPLHPLAPSASYFVMLTNGLHATDGQPFTVDATYALAKRTDPVINDDGVSLVPALTNAEAQTLEPLRREVNANENFMVAYDSNLDRSRLIMTWSLSTQSIGAVLPQTRNMIRGAAAPAVEFQDISALVPLAAATIYAGTLSVPYYLSLPSADNPTAPLTSFWHSVAGSTLTQFNATPIKTTDVTIPLLLSVPKTATPPLPVVVFQHGITANRSAMLAVADTLAAMGLAVVAIDLPLHGILGTETDGTQNLAVPAIERHFNLDLVHNATGMPGADGTIDASGQHFINLRNLVVARDNLRQSVADLFALAYALEAMDYDGGGADFDTSKIYFLGHSLGAIAGVPFIAFETSIKAAVLAMPGGGIAKTLDGSANFGPVLAAVLAFNGIHKGSADYESFLGAAQSLLDTADPINYTALIGGYRGLMVVEVVGGNSSPSDLVVPNSVPDGNDDGTTVAAPLAGTDPFASALGLTQYHASATGSHLQAWLRFTAGHHASPLRATDANGNDDALSARVTVEMQHEIATFLASDGTDLTVTDDTVLAAP